MSGFAWVTLATNDSYSLGALVLAHSLKQANTKHRLVALITPGVTGAMRDKLSVVFDLVEEVNVLDSKDEANLKLLKRPELGVTFTKLHCWRLVQFEKCVFLDADTLVLTNCDELFNREEFSAAPDVGWPDCFNSGVFVYKPSNETYEKLVDFALLRGSFDGGDQGLLNLYFSDWAHKDIAKHLPFIYNMCSTAVYSYLPAFKQYGKDAKIVHFIGPSKPWLQYFNTETMTVYPSPGLQHLEAILQKWWNIFCSSIHPNLTPDMSGLAGAFAQFTLGAKRSEGQDALENHLRRQAWEVGNIDYLGRDSFDHIWSKICETLAGKPEEPAGDAAAGGIKPGVTGVEQQTAKDQVTEPPKTQAETASQPDVVPQQTTGELPKEAKKLETAAVPVPKPEDAPKCEIVPKEPSAPATAPPEPPKSDAAPAEAPKVESVSVEQPKTEIAPVELPKMEPEVPKTETAPVEPPKTEVAAVEAPKVEQVVSKTESAPVEQPKVEAVPVEPPKVEAVPVEPPKAETVPVELPKVEPVPVEPPKVDAVPVEPPKPEVAPVEAPKPEAVPIEPPKTEAVPVELPKVEAIPLEAPKTEAVPVEPPKKEAVPIEPAKTEAVPVEPPKTEVVPVEPPKTEGVPVEPPKTEAVPVEPPKSADAPIEPPKVEPVPAELQKPESAEPPKIAPEVPPVEAPKCDLPAKVDVPAEKVEAPKTEEVKPAEPTTDAPPVEPPKPSESTVVPESPQSEVSTIVTPPTPTEAPKSEAPLPVEKKEGAEQEATPEQKPEEGKEAGQDKPKKKVVKKTKKVPKGEGEGGAAELPEPAPGPEGSTPTPPPRKPTAVKKPKAKKP